MAFDSTREQFEAIANGIDLQLQNQTQMPGQAVTIAYDDLKVQRQTAAMRWRVAPLKLPAQERSFGSLRAA